MKEEGVTAAVLARTLLDVFGIDRVQMAEILCRERYPVAEIGAVLRDFYGVSAGDAAALLREAGITSALDLAEMLTDEFGLADRPMDVATILKGVGFEAGAILDVLRTTFGLTGAALMQMLNALGFSADDLFAATSKDLAERFAPQLRFDQAATTFPMSAQAYFADSIQSTAGRTENTDPTTLTSVHGQPPTYFKAFRVGTQVRIVYWWYYGYQPGCWEPLVGAQGTHDGDWEHVVVTLSEDQSKVVAVTYFQHRGSYTRLASGGDADTFLGADYAPGLQFFGEHPIVFVGKSQHGSYHNEGGGGWPDTDLPGCTYFDDWRNNVGRSDRWLDAQNNLKSLADLDDEWMREEMPVIDGRLGTGNGSRRTFDLGSRLVNAESLTVKIDGVPVAPAEVSLADGTVVDQITLSHAPAAGAAVTADYEKAFQWGPGGIDGIGTHPTTASTAESIGTLPACEGFDATFFGEVRGCFASQCQHRDNQTGWTELHPGTCSHCPEGFTDMGFYCGKGFWPWEWDTTSIHYYGLDYAIPTTDAGLARKK